jgi:glycerate 2-kinase
MLCIALAAPRPGHDAFDRICIAPAASLRGFSFAGIGWITGVACFHPQSREAMTDHRPLLRAIFDAAVAAAHPDVVLATHLPPAPKGRVVCLAAGKGAAAMAAAAERHYLDALELEPSLLSGIATTRHGHGVPTRRIKVIEAGHPVPDEAGLTGAEDSLRLAQAACADDLLLVLLSGGGSANWIAPVEGVSFAQKQALTRALLRSGAPIGEVNAVRKHLSRIKGGRLARAGQRAGIVTLAISDVPHNDPTAIASGPTVPDPTTLADARAIVAKYGLDVDDAIRRALEDPANESCKVGDGAFARAQFELIARPKASLEAATGIAEDAGYRIIDLGADLEGEARSVAADHAQLALRARAAGGRVAILSGGELTVTVRGHGRGGPNQEYALALAGLLKETAGISALAADTDGADGGAGSAADPAGAVIDARTFAKMKSLGLDAKAYLADNDATSFFEKTGDLLITGPTLTNVNDIRVILVDGV